MAHIITDYFITYLCMEDKPIMEDLYNTGKLQIIKQLPSERTYRPNAQRKYVYMTYVLAKCWCGNVWKINKANLSRTTQCKNHRGIKHNGLNTPEYQSWKSMVARCTNPNRDKYSRYIKRGIKVCDRWLGENGFVNFRNDMGARQRKDLTLDRINPDGNYEPSNCRWADKLTQTLNRSKL